jgi:hypothetical protein
MSKRVRKVGAVTRVGDAEILQDGGSEESVVAAWWDSLDVAKRASIASMCGADCDALGKWEDLNPIGQQMRIHMWYDDHPGV